jgi:hypothetical protein
MKLFLKSLAAAFQSPVETTLHRTGDMVRRSHYFCHSFFAGGLKLGTDAV